MEEFKILTPEDNPRERNEITIYKTDKGADFEVYTDDDSFYKNISIDQHHAERIVETLKKLFNI